MPINRNLAAGVLALAGIVLARLVFAWTRFRGQRVITCPENQQPAGVILDGWLAARTGLIGKLELQLSCCSRWPEYAGCQQRCLAEIAASPEECLVRKILTDWYAGKSCASCGRPFGDIESNGQKPALMGIDRISVEWHQVDAERLHDVLAASLPLCFACHLANTLVREHPELVVERSTNHTI